MVTKLKGKALVAGPLRKELFFAASLRWLITLLVRYVTPLKDSWVEGNGVEGGETSETPANSFTYRLVNLNYVMITSSVADQFRFDTDPDPQIRFVEKRIRIRLWKTYELFYYFFFFWLPKNIGRY